LLYTLLGVLKIMEYYLAEIQILKLKSFYQLIKAESFEKAQEIAEREFSVKDGYRVNLKVTLQ